MLPFGLKIVFFVLSITGTSVSALVLVAFAKAIDVYWVSASYASANFLLQAAFCLGMIWRMDPFLMPHWFCVTQTVAISLGAFVLTGVCTCFSVATSAAVFRPSKIRDFSTLRWRNVYFLFMCVFPAAASAAQIVVILKVNAVRPSDDLHCDASHPVWVRFLGYSGLSLLLAVPSFVLTSIAIWRLFRTPRSVNTSSSRLRTLSSGLHMSNGGVDSDFVMDSRQSVHSSPSPMISPPNSAHLFLDKTQNYHSFSFPQSHPWIRPGAFPMSATNLDHAITPGDSPKISISSNSPRVIDETDPYSVNYVPDKTSIGAHDIVEMAQSTDYFSRNSLDSALSRLDSDFPDATHKPNNLILEEPLQLSYPQLSRSLRTKSTSSKPAQNFGPAIWRLLFFQISFFLIECFAALSTIIDVAKQRQIPTPFGTQHVALILAAWGPFFVFSHLPAVRKQFFRRLQRRQGDGT